MDELEPLLTVFVDHPDYNKSDEQAEADRLFQRQQAIAGLLDGSVPVDYCLDLLEAQGINPHAWIDASLQNMEWAMQGDLILPA
jgi:hypothetical protein